MYGLSYKDASPLLLSGAAAREVTSVTGEAVAAASALAFFFLADLDSD
jgi:hypothetical protein